MINDRFRNDMWRQQHYSLHVAAIGSMLQNWSQSLAISVQVTLFIKHTALSFIYPDENQTADKGDGRKARGYITWGLLTKPKLLNLNNLISLLN